MKKILLYAGLATGVGMLAALLQRYKESVRNYGKHSIGSHSRYPSRSMYYDLDAFDEFDEYEEENLRNLFEKKE